MIDLDTLTQGAHDDRGAGVCLLELRRRADGTLGPRDPALRLLDKITVGGPDECWPWSTGKYGSIKIGGKAMKAHRFAYELFVGPVPETLDVLHRCDNPPCCNPRHLFLGTDIDNARDRQAKGRTRGLVTGAGAADQRSKSHCPAGHEYSGVNVRHRPDGRRRCAACYRIRSQNRRNQQRGAL